MLGWRKSLFVWALMIETATGFAPGASAASETILYSFHDKAVPVQPLMEKADGTLIGIARDGGFGYGAVFRLKEQNGAWTEKGLYRFPGNSAYPSNVIEHAGALYGVTAEGGDYGSGTIFSLTRASGHWAESTLYSFTGGKDGTDPSLPPLWVNRAGAFFGVTPANFDAPPNCGTVYSLAPAGTETTLHRFKGRTDGCTPNAELHELHTGDGLSLVGTTVGGGKGNGGEGDGTVFVVTEQGGHWDESVIYRFTDNGDGVFPGDIVVDSDDNIFGVNTDGGGRGHGDIFQLSPSGGQWTEQTLHIFTNNSGGENPAGLCRDSATGNLYGVTTYGGKYTEGIVFQLAQSNGAWTETVLHSFGTAGDGQYPASRPIYDPKTRTLYGTTRNGGRFNGGVVYAVSLSGGHD